MLVTGMQMALQNQVDALDQKNQHMLKENYYKAGSAILSYIYYFQGEQYLCLKALKIAPSKLSTLKLL